MYCYIFKTVLWWHIEG